MINKTHQLNKTLQFLKKAQQVFYKNATISKKNSKIGQNRKISKKDHPTPPTPPIPPTPIAIGQKIKPYVVISRKSTTIDNRTPTLKPLADGKNNLLVNKINSGKIEKTDLSLALKFIFGIKIPKVMRIINSLQYKQLVTSIFSLIILQKEFDKNGNFRLLKTWN